MKKVFLSDLGDIVTVVTRESFVILRDKNFIWVLGRRMGRKLVFFMLGLGTLRKGLEKRNINLKSSMAKVQFSTNRTQTKLC